MTEEDKTTASDNIRRCSKSNYVHKLLWYVNVKHVNVKYIRVGVKYVNVKYTNVKYVNVRFASIKYIKCQIC